MIKNKLWFLVGFCGVLILFWLGVLLLKNFSGADGSGAGAGQGANVNQNQAGSALGDTASGAVTITTLSDGDELVHDSAHGYSFTMPSNWYVEQSSGAAVAVYPDYDPTKAFSAPATCKIEITKFSNAIDASASAPDLNAWVTAELHRDPTANVVEASRTKLVVGGAPAIEWQGNLNGVTTTLAYVGVPAAQAGSVFEIAPSTIAGGDGGVNSGAKIDDASDDCDLAFEALLNNFDFGNYNHD